MIPAQQEEQGIFSPTSPSKIKLSSRSNRVKRLVNLGDAILVVGMIIGSALLLFSHRTITVQSQAGGLEASLRITSGPYFLSELLGVQISLTDHSSTSVLLDGFATSIRGVRC